MSKMNLLRAIALAGGSGDDSQATGPVLPAIHAFNTEAPPVATTLSIYEDSASAAESATKAERAATLAVVSVSELTEEPAAAADAKVAAIDTDAVDEFAPAVVLVAVAEEPTELLAAADVDIPAEPAVASPVIGIAIPAMPAITSTTDLQVRQHLYEDISILTRTAVRLYSVTRGAQLRTASKLNYPLQWRMGGFTANPHPL